jgi:hypothetical protein
VSRFFEENVFGKGCIVFGIFLFLNENIYVIIIFALMGAFLGEERAYFSW